jgi:propionate CoA-transferase
MVEQGLELIEVAPGIDVERDILGQMDFRPLIRGPQPMPAHVLHGPPDRA